MQEKKDLFSNKNSELVQKTLDLYAVVPGEKGSFNEAYNNFKKSMQKARETLVTREVNSTESLKPEVQETLHGLKATVPKEVVSKIINISDQQKNKALSVVSSGKELPEAQKEEYIRKMDNITVSQDVSNINATVVSYMIDNMAKNNNGPRIK